MKQVFKMAPLALAVAAISFSGLVAAGGGDGDHRHHDGASISKDVHVTKDVHYVGGALVLGIIGVDSLGMAVVDVEQDADDNLSINKKMDNNATLGGNALKGAKGNIGFNAAAGDNNVQSNAAALAAADASFVFGSADAEIFVDQNAEDNETFYWGSTNNATLGGNALQNARGNIGVNIAAGNNNAQSNALAGAFASGSMGEATVSVEQETEKNMTHNLPTVEEDEVKTLDINLNFATTSGTYTGTSDQDGGVYPEVWLGGDHGDGTSQSGHLDFDDNNPPGTGNQKGTFSFNEQGDIALQGVITGSIDLMTYTYTRHENNAVMGGNALQNAHGNIGVNVSAGTGNMQSNALAVSRLAAE